MHNRALRYLPIFVLIFLVRLFLWKKMLCIGFTTKSLDFRFLVFWFSSWFFLKVFLKLVSNCHWVTSVIILDNRLLFISVLLLYPHIVLNEKIHFLLPFCRSCFKNILHVWILCYKSFQICIWYCVETGFCPTYCCEETFSTKQEILNPK